MASNVSFQNTVLSADIRFGENGYDVTIQGQMHDTVSSGYIQYMAANPPEYRATFSGSGLPFANKQQAFDNSVNYGVCKLENDAFVINIAYPNSYYIGLGTVLVPPTLYLYYTDVDNVERMVAIKISEGIPYRSLTYPKARSDVTFYNGGWELPVRTQEAILRDSAYPCMNICDADFWGMKPRQ